MPENRPVCCGRPMKIKIRNAPRIRYQCLLCHKTTTGTPASQHEASQHPGYDTAAAAAYADLVEAAVASGQRRFVVTAAQNNTAVHNRFLRALLRYCWHNGAMLLVIPAHYKNVSLYTAAQEYKKEWDAAVHPYLIDRNVEIGGQVMVMAGINVAVTMLNPLVGKEPIGGQKWTIFGHPQFAMESVASPGDLRPKRMYTTGAVTLKNYSRTNVGAKAEFHHVYGALAVEIAGDHAFIRQLNAKALTGDFIDLGWVYPADKPVTRASRALAVTPGDEHVEHILPEVKQAIFTARDSVVKTLRPQYIVRHDVFDGYSISHHHEKDDILRYRKFWAHKDNVALELERTAKHINETTPKDCASLIVPSNHHDHLQKWLERADPKKDHVNSRFLYRMKLKQQRAALAGQDYNPFNIYLRERLTCRYKILDKHKPYVLAGVNYNQHGDYGPNGSRGNARALAKTTYKMVIGHSHGARIVRGVYQVGTCTGMLEYERGLSDHSNTLCVQYANGKRTLIDIFDGKWRLPEIVLDTGPA